MSWLGESGVASTEDGVLESDTDDGSEGCHGAGVWEDGDHHVVSLGGICEEPLEGVDGSSVLCGSLSEKSIGVSGSDSPGGSVGWKLITKLVGGSSSLDSTVLVEGTVTQELVGSSGCDGFGVFEVDSAEGIWSSWLAGSLWDDNSWLEHGLEEISLSGLLGGELRVVLSPLGLVVTLGSIVGVGHGGVGGILSAQLEEVHGGSGGEESEAGL